MVQLLLIKITIDERPSKRVFSFFTNIVVVLEQEIYNSALEFILFKDCVLNNKTVIYEEF